MSVFHICHFANCASNSLCEGQVNLDLSRYIKQAMNFNFVKYHFSNSRNDKHKKNKAKKKSRLPLKQRLENKGHLPASVVRSSVLCYHGNTLRVAVKIRLRFLPSFVKNPFAAFKVWPPLLRVKSVGRASFNFLESI